MTAPALIDLVAPIIKVDGTELAASVLTNLTGMRIHRGLRLPARCVLQFDDTGFAITGGSTFAVGTMVAIFTADNTMLFQGEVTGLDLEFEDAAPALSVQIDDAAYQMTLGTKVRTFTQMKFSDVARKIAGEYGLTVKVDDTGETFPYLLQTDTDFGFLDEIAERIGYDWWVLGRQLFFCKPAVGATPVVQLALGRELTRFAVHASALHPGTPTVRGWSQKLKQDVTGTSSTSQSPLPSSAAFTGHIKASKLTAQTAVTTSTSAPMDAAEATSLAGGLISRWQVGAVSARGTCRISPKIAPGAAIGIEQAGPVNGTYHVTEVEHSYTMYRGFETRFTAGDRAPTGLVDTLAGRDPGTSSFRQTGVVVGVITQIGGPQSLEPGKVKVKYAALSSIESNWARVVTMGAGSKRGMTFLPEVNDEVLVAFEGGDVRRPLVLGSLYNGKDIPAEFGVNNGKIGKRRITSRLGHYVEMSDGDADPDQHIALMLSTGKHSVRLGKDKLTAEVPAGTPVSISSGRAKFEITADGSITIAGQKVSIKAETDVEIQGLNVITKAQVKVAASGTMAEITATGKAQVSANGPLQLKGNPVMVN